MSGFYLMHRGWQNNPALDPDEAFCKRAAWAWLVERAAYEPIRVKAGTKIVTLSRGQLTCSLRFIAQAWGWGHERVRRFLMRLQTEAMIETTHETGQCTITICNYEQYQSPAQPRETAGETPNETATRQQRDKVKEVKEGKESKKDSEAIASGGKPPSNDPVKEMWARGVRILGPGSNSVIGQAVKEFKQVAVMEAIIACEHENPVDPIAFFLGCLKQRRTTSNGRRPDPHAADLAAFEFVTRPKLETASYWGDDSQAVPPLLDAAGTA